MLPEGCQQCPTNCRPTRRIGTRRIILAGRQVWTKMCLARLAKVAFGGFAGVLPNVGQAIVWWTKLTG